MRIHSGIAVTMAMLTCGSVLAAEAVAPGKPASIAFARLNIRDWRADGEKGLWVQAAGGAWYYGSFSFPCQGLQFKNALRFNYGATGELDRWGGVQTREAGKCPFKTFETSTGPPVPQQPQPAAPATAPAAPG